MIVLLASGQGFRNLLGIPAYSAVVVATVVIVAIAYRPTWKGLIPPLLIGSFLGLAALSILWSATRAISLLGVLTLVVTSFMALAIVRVTTVGRFMGMLYRGFQISLFLGVAFEAVVAFIIRHPIEPLSGDLLELSGEHYQGPHLWSENNLLGDGYLQGFVGNRNPFGAIALVALIGVVILFLDGRIGRIDALFTFTIGVAVLSRTQSATVAVGLIYVLGLFIAGLIIRAAPRRWKRTLSFSVLGLTAAGAILTLKFHGLIFELFDRSPDATNRADIWGAMFDFAIQRPLSLIHI